MSSDKFTHKKSRSILDCNFLKWYLSVDEEKELPYPKEAMLPTVDYQELVDMFFDSHVVDLEYETMRNLSDFTHARGN